MATPNEDDLDDFDLDNMNIPIESSRNSANVQHTSNSIDPQQADAGGGDDDFLEWLDQEEADYGSNVIVDNNIVDDDDDSFDFDKDVLGEEEQEGLDLAVKVEEEEEDEMVMVDGDEDSDKDLKGKENVENGEKEDEGESGELDGSETSIGYSIVAKTAVVDKNEENISGLTVDNDAEEAVHIIDGNQNFEEISSIVESVDDIKHVVSNTTSEEPANPVTVEKPVTIPENFSPSATEPSFGIDKFSDMIRSNASSIMQIKKHYKINMKDESISALDRPHLWTKLICGKTLDTVENSSMAQSLTSLGSYVSNSFEDSETSVVSQLCALRPDYQRDVLEKELSFLLDKKLESWKGVETAMLHIAAVIVASGLKSPASLVIMRSIVPCFLPLVGLDHLQRIEALEKLHKEFYLLACYHLPMLVQHLDRYTPGWFWPKLKSISDNNNDDDATKIGRNLKAYGAIPVSWFASCFASSLSIQSLMLTWDKLLCSNEPSFKFFLALAYLEKNATSLLMTKGEDVRVKLDEVLSMKDTVNGIPAASFVSEWFSGAEFLRDSSPASVLSQMNKVEDDAIASNNKMEEEKVEQKLQDFLKKEAEERRIIELQEELRKSEKANHATNKKRLQQYYEKYNCAKVDDVEKVLKHYKGRLPALERNLIAKYGEGFDPVLPGVGMMYALAESKESFLSAFKVKAKNAGLDENGLTFMDNGDVSFRLFPADVLHSLFTKKKVERSDSHDDFKYVLVDARNESSSSKNGRFPTAIAIKPEQLIDPDSLNEIIEMFENIRGSVHICVMGNGFGSLPDLYDVRLSDEAKEASAEDNANVNLCALLMIKKGFPFVSILDGGFAAAHSWLCREGPTHSLDVGNLLIEYEEESEWASLEKNYKERVESQSVIDIEGKSSILSTMRAEIAQRSMLSSISKLVNPREAIVFSTTKLFAMKDGVREDKGETEDIQKDSTLEKTGQLLDTEANVDKKSSKISSFKLKKSFSQFSINFKKKQPSPGSSTDGSSLESSSSDEGEKTSALGEKKKNLFGGFQRRQASGKGSKLAPKPKFKTDVFKRNPFSKFRKGKGALFSRESSDSDSEEISFGTADRNADNAFDIGNLSDEE